MLFLIYTMTEETQFLMYTFLQVVQTH